MDLVTSGWLNVYKPSGISSSSTVLKIKRNFKLKKIGHGGTLDPEAEGILPIAFGYTTKILSFVENSYKKYTEYFSKNKLKMIFLIKYQKIYKMLRKPFLKT